MLMIFAVDALKGRRSGGNYCTGAAAPWRPHCTPTYMSRRLWWINVFTVIRPCCLFYPQLSHHLQRPLPSSAVLMSLSPKNESINLSFYPSLLSPLVFVFQAIIFPRSSLIWFQSLSVSSEAGEPKRNPDGFEATIVCLLKAVHIPKGRPTEQRAPFNLDPVKLSGSFTFMSFLLAAEAKENFFFYYIFNIVKGM